LKSISGRLERQIQFLIEIDKTKQIFRKTKLFDKSRFENAAEHAWRLALMALVLGEYVNEKIDLAKIIKMILIHDIVEIDAGDTIVYDTKSRTEAQEKESLAAERIFGILPEDQKNTFITLWKEFEERRSPEAKFAAAIDRFEPILQNRLTDYYAWKAHGISYAQLQDGNRHIQDGSEVIWAVVQEIFSEAKDKSEIKDE
jgi:putative hydrolase of HD superfamily